MCLKEVDLNVNRTLPSDKLPDPEEREPNQNPVLSSEFPPEKNGWRAITKKERRDFQLKNCINGSGNSVAHKASPNPQGTRIKSEEEKTRVLKIQKTKRSSAVQKCSISGAVKKWILLQLCGTKVLSSAAQKLLWKPDTVAKWIVLLLLYGKVCRADGAGDTFFGNGFPPSIKLDCQVPPSSQAKWLYTRNGRPTAVKIGPQEGSISLDGNQNLIIGHQDLENYDCEIQHPNGGRTLQRFPLLLFSAHCAMTENEDFDDFKKGKKHADVELEWKTVVKGSSANVSQRYIFMFQNRTLEIFPENKTDLQSRPASIQCNIRFKEIEMKPHTNVSNAIETDEETTTNKEGDKGKSSDKEKSSNTEKCSDRMFVGIVCGAMVSIAIVICLHGCWYVKNRCLRAQDIRNKVKAVPAIEDGLLSQTNTTSE